MQPETTPANSLTEAAPLLVQRNRNRHVNSGHFNGSMCGACTRSKAAIIVLIWSLMVLFAYNFLLNPEVLQRYSGLSATAVNSLRVYSFIGRVSLLFYPLFGYCSDSKCGRFKCIRVSLFLLFLTFILGLLLSIKVILNMMNSSPSYSRLSNGMLAAYILGLILVHVAVVAFIANVIQFGLDQLQDLPSQDSSLFIHWYVCVYYICWFTAQLTWSMYFGYMILESLSILSVLMIPITLIISCKKQDWFSIDSSRKINPFRLVYRVTKFAFRHKVPVRRSAFTYCEDEPPSRLDLGKGKFGGPFTTEQVEDVKVFYGILKVLLSLGPVFFLEIPLKYTAAVHYWNLQWDNFHTPVTAYTLSLPAVVIASLLLYLCVLRHFIAHLVPGMLKRMGIGFFITLLPLLYIFVVYSVRDFLFKDISIMNQNNSVACFVNVYVGNNSSSDFVIHHVKYLIPQSVLSGISQMFVYIAMYEFICAQSPHHMKGLLIGLSFAIKGLFQSIATMLFLITTFFTWTYSSFSCELLYSLVFLTFGFLAFVVFACVARRYQYRVRDEPCRVRQYAEDYYSNVP